MAIHDPPGAAAPPPLLLDESTRPDFRDVYGRLSRRALGIDVAVLRIRLGGLDLREDEMQGVGRVRVLLAEVNAARLGAEAAAVVVDPGKAENVRVLVSLFREGRLQIRSSPLGGWAPDFSLFHSAAGPFALLLGPHWFQRPYPFPGPALASLHGGADARRVAGRFRRLWEGAHDVGTAVRGIVEGAAHPPSQGSHRVL